MSLFDWLSPALTATTNTVGAYQGAQADATKEQVAAQIQALKQQHDAERQALQDQVSRATARHLDAESEKLNRPVPKKVYDAARGVMVNEDEGSFAAIPGLPDKPIAPKFAPKSFVENGTPVEGLVDEEGKFWHADHTPATGKITPWSPPQHDPPPQIISAVDPQTNAPKFFRVPKEGGDATEIGGIAPKPTAAGGGERSGMAAAFLSRLKMGKADFDNGMNFIRDYHQKLARGEEQITPTMMAESAAASTGPNPDAHGALAGLSNAGTAMMQGFANKTLAGNHTEYQRYVNLLNSMSLAMTEVLPRPTAQILGIEKGINTAKTGDTPERLQDIQHRLDKAYEYLFANPDAMLQRGPATPSGTAASTGNGHPTKTLPPLSAEDRAHAAREPRFAAWLTTQGYE